MTQPLALAPDVPVPLRILTPAARPVPPLSRVLLLGLAAGWLLERAAAVLGLREGNPLTVMGVLLVAVLGCRLASWLEHRVYLRLTPLPGLARIAISGAQVPLAVLGALLTAGIVQAVASLLHLGPAPAVAIFVGGLWYAGAALGTSAMTTADVAVSALVPGFRDRILGSVLLLVTDIAIVAGLLTRGADALVAQLRHGLPAGFRIDVGPGSDARAAQQVAQWVDANPGVTTAILVGVGALVALPAVVSASAKLAEGVMERIHPLSLAFDAVAMGQRDVHLEEKGSRDFIELAQRFNRMIDELSLAERIERAFGLYVSLKVVDRIKAQHGDAFLPASMREASVFFADIRGFTAMSEKLAPDVIASVLNRYFERVVDVVEAHDGYLDKFIGDAVVVVFNAPLDQPDHALRAVRCAVALQAAVAELNAREAFPEIGELRVGVGVATGPMICGNIGSRRQLEYTVIGDTVNLAARLCGHAPGGEVWLSARTVEGADGQVPTEVLPPLQVKGKVEPVVPSRVVQARAA